MHIEAFLYTFLASLFTLFPVVNPIGNGFIVNGFMTGIADEEKMKIIKRVVIYCLLVGIGTLVLGRFLLLLFGLNVAVIQLGGGIMICKTGFELLGDSEENKEESKEEKSSLNNLQSRIFYPISFPIIMGPGSISVILTMMATTAPEASYLHTSLNYLIILLALIAICSLLYFCLTKTNTILKKLGSSGHLIINKLIAFFTFCIGLQIAVTGISKIFNISIF